jgi:hypothetical protein
MITVLMNEIMNLKIEFRNDLICTVDDIYGIHDIR